MKKLALLLAFFCALAGAQTFPVNNLTVSGTSSFTGTMSGTGLTTHDAGVNHVQTVLNVAALRALSCVPGLVYTDQGYYTLGDGGQMTYVCNGSDTTTPDNGATILAAANSFRYYAQYTGPFNVRAAGAKGDNSTNDSAAFNVALNLGVTAYIPKGNYLVNSTITQKFNVYGDGSNISILKPFSTTTAVLTYNPAPTSPYWTYHSSVKSLGFVSTGTMAGVGFTFGATTQAAYTAGMEYANNVDFYNDKFYGFQKGIQFPFGNIGTSFYDCGFTANYYGVYSIDNKQYPAISGSNAMHAGNKYFYSGEFDQNVIGVYVNNATSGFGGVDFYSTIFENEPINQYIYSSQGDFPDPINLSNPWVEAYAALDVTPAGGFVVGGSYTIASVGTTNFGAIGAASNTVGVVFTATGAGSGTGTATPTSMPLDVYTGATPTPTMYAVHNTIIDGAGMTINVNGGFFGDTYLKATSSRVLDTNSHVETFPSFGGFPSQVDDVNSQIIIYNPETSGGVPTNSRTIVKGNFRPITYNVTSGANSSRAAFVSHRYNKLGGSYGGSGTVVNLTAASNLGNGSFTVTAGTTADGVIYGTANTYSAPFTTTSQDTALIASTQSISAGQWCAMTVDVKVTSGSPLFNSWDRNTNQMYSQLAIPELNQWYTIGAYGYFPNAVATYYGLDVGTAAATTATFELSAYQFRCFNTQRETQDFLESGVYVGP
jgi:hypothetical protein